VGLCGSFGLPAFGKNPGKAYCELYIVDIDIIGVCFALAARTAQIATSICQVHMSHRATQKRPFYSYIIQGRTYSESARLSSWSKLSKMKLSARPFWHLSLSLEVFVRVPSAFCPCPFTNNGGIIANNGGIIDESVGIIVA
jgi:hypothetical protein